MSKKQEETMNKRIKKKRILFEYINTLGIVLDQALKIINEQKDEIIELRSIVERNAQATNRRFAELEKSKPAKWPWRKR